MKPVLVFRHVAREPLGTIDDVLRRAGLVFSYVNLYQRPPTNFDPRQIAGLVVLGGPMSVNDVDRYPFLRNEIKWIQSAVDLKIPLLGICLGSQLLAAALGARAVMRSPTKEIGWYDLETTDAAPHDRLFRHLGKRETVFQWHGDTFDLPAGAVHLARSPICENQAFRYGDSAWALQFHLEVTPEIIETWLSEPDGCAELAKLDYIEPAQIRSRTPSCLPPMQKTGDRVFGEFAQLCRQCAAASP